uniref:DUF4160 domain-containing protein n=1 Tax=Candidatus Kentrum sp. LPFa TaxID=2126335 RepID=A0A450WWS5_9GAMM|nr:MAG: protein of unknown function (DUF4160) [Candidatus Kentron sp. LPFa]VFK35187.1 MAG: protein of unknown function (DUF4160) [Candidatus Kentron sp. LPFa]
MIVLFRIFRESDYYVESLDQYFAYPRGVESLPRHIHIEYGEHMAVMELENLDIVEGRLPKRCRQLVREWAKIHQQKLIEMWDTQNFHRVDPLE